MAHITTTNYTSQSVFLPSRERDRMGTDDDDDVDAAAESNMRGNKERKCFPMLKKGIAMLWTASFFFSLSGRRAHSYREAVCSCCEHCCSDRSSSSVFRQSFFVVGRCATEQNEATAQGSPKQISSIISNSHHNIMCNRYYLD